MKETAHQVSRFFLLLLFYGITVAIGVALALASGESDADAVGDRDADGRGDADTFGLIRLDFGGTP